ncbi:hypothetical protein [Paenirhodobacter sp. CAU 1674]|uniref:hypothetical protein n=1 Tax=Paenirhodobacter sp. CAU 1674 TaxID=3032596 RepID=UPI0023DA56DA|nr:hypothetical protein [Paenirhodobacter sp. CAU 1674]MDF2143262.1 hypothetical protein [Paenirhodobacter sp. CAU 1674]
MDDYLWRDKSKTVLALRHILIKEFGDFDRVSIFGGMIRDIARDGKRGFRSDVDLVIDAPADQVKNLAKRLSAKPNMFGGFGHRSTRWEIDFWALETTWAHRNGYIKASSVDDLLQGTFFDWDAAHYDIKSRKLYSQHGYLERIRSRTLGVNLIKTPSAVGNAVRTVRRVLLWDLKASSGLLDFVDQVVADEGLEALVHYEKRKHQRSVCEGFAERSRLLEALSAGNRKVHSLRSSPRQMELPGLIPHARD